MSFRENLRGFLSRIAGRPDRKSLARQFPRATFGRHTYANNLRVHDWGEGSRLTVGAFCSIAADVQIFLGGEHRTDWVTTFPFNVLWPAGRTILGHPATKGDVVIGSDVWIGQGATILSGVTVGHGAVVGAMSLVARSVPPYTIVGGNPAKPLRSRFSDEEIEALLALRWWEWSDERIGQHLPLLLQSDVRSFLASASG